MSFMNIDAKIFNRILANWIKKYWNNYILGQVEFLLGMQSWFNILKSIYVIYHIKSTIEKKITWSYQ